MRSRFRTALDSTAAPVLGTWIKLPLMESVEMMALAGFDFVVIDLEHSSMSVESAHALIGTALHVGISPFVRVPALEGGMVQRILDSGAEGIMLPHVDSVADARAAVSAMRFPPIGDRGVGSTSRAGAWGSVPRSEYVRYGNEEVAFIAQIESAAAVRAAGEIASVDGVDALLVGAADLSTSEGRIESDPEIVELIAEAVQASRRVGVPIGCAGGATAASVQDALDGGFAFAIMSNDATMLHAAASAAVDAGRSIRHE